MGAKIPESTVKNGEALLEHTTTNANTPEELEMLEKRLRRKIDLRLCSICGILMSLNLVDSGILSSASVTSLFDDLHLYGSRYSVSIFIFSIALVACQLPGALAVRWLGPRVLLSATTVCFGLVTLCTAFIQTWQQMIAMRVLLGIAVAPVLPGASYLVSSWYPRREQGLRYAILQVFQTCVMATGTLISFGLNHLDGRAGLRGWRWMYLVHGLAATVIGVVSYWWMVDFPENAQNSFCFLSEKETQLAVARIDRDRRDVIAEPFAWRRILVHLVDPKAYLFAAMGFVGNMVSTTLSYFLPIIIQGMGFSSNMAILLSTPPYYWAVIPVVCTCFLADRWRLRGPFVVFNCSCIIAGILMIGLAPGSEVARRYAGAFLGTGAFVSNWAMQYAYLANNMAGQWKRATSIAIVTTFQGLGAVAGSYVVRQQEAPRYPTAVWAITGLQILTIVIVGVLTVYFYLRNRQQRVGRHIIQNIAGFRYTY